MRAGHKAKLNDETIRTKLFEATNSESLNAPANAMGVARNKNSVTESVGRKNSGALSNVSAQTQGSAAPTNPKPIECEVAPAWPNISNQLEESGSTPGPETATFVGTQGRFSASNPSAHQIAPEEINPEFGVTCNSSVSPRA